MNLYKEIKFKPKHGTNIEPPGLKLRVCNEIKFFYFSTKTYVVGTQRKTFQ